MKDDSDDTTACTVTPTQSPVETEAEGADTHSARLVRAVDDFKPKNSGKIPSKANQYIFTI